MHSSNTGRGTGCGTNPQSTIDEIKEETVSDEVEREREEREIDYIKNELPKDSPIIIPQGAKITDQQKTAGYRQIKYQWQRGKYKYTSRWHQRTPNAPIDQGNTWVVERKIDGIGYGPNARPRKVEILVGKNKSGKNIWVDAKTWDKAIKANKKGIATDEQKEMLKNGHWKSKK